MRSSPCRYGIGIRLTADKGCDVRIGRRISPFNRIALSKSICRVIYSRLAEAKKEKSKKQGKYHFQKMILTLVMTKRMIGIFKNKICHAISGIFCPILYHIKKQSQENFFKAVFLFFNRRHNVRIKKEILPQGRIS